MADDWLATEFSRLAALSPEIRQREIDALPADKRAAIKAQNEKVQPPRPQASSPFAFPCRRHQSSPALAKGATRPPRREHRARLPRAGRGGPRRVGAHGGGARRAVLLSVPQARSLPPHIRVHETQLTHLLRTLLKGSSASPQPHRRRGRARRPAAARGLL